MTGGAPAQEGILRSPSLLRFASWLLTREGDSIRGAPASWLSCPGYEPLTGTGTTLAGYVLPRKTFIGIPVTCARSLTPGSSNHERWPSLRWIRPSAERVTGSHRPSRLAAS